MSYVLFQHIMIVLCYVCVLFFCFVLIKIVVGYWEVNADALETRNDDCVETRREVSEQTSSGRKRTRKDDRIKTERNLVEFHGIRNGFSSYFLNVYVVLFCCKCE